MNQASVFAFIMYVFFGLLMMISVNGAYNIGDDLYSGNLMDIKADKEEESILSLPAPSPHTLKLKNKSDEVTEFEKSLPDGYEYTPGIGAHKLHTYGGSFNDGRKRCIMEGAYLAIINSMAEEWKLADMFRRVPDYKFVNVQSKGEARLGIHDLFQKFEWVTIFGDPLYSTGWARWGVTSDGVRQPDNAGGNEDCANLMINNGGMNDVRCDLPYAFFCELHVPH